MVAVATAAATEFPMDVVVVPLFGANTMIVGCESVMGHHRRSKCRMSVHRWPVKVDKMIGVVDTSFYQTILPFLAVFHVYMMVITR